MLQLRPKGSSDPFYAPHRDMAYLFPNLAMAAMRGLDPGNWESWYGDVLTAAGVTAEQLGAGAEVLGEFVNRAAEDKDEQIPQHVLERLGWDKLPKPVQYTIYAKLGQMALSAYFMSIREVTHLGELPPLDLAAIVAQAEKTAHYLSLPGWRRSVARGLDSLKAWLGRKLLGKAEPKPALPSGPRSFGEGFQAAPVAEPADNVTINKAVELPAVLPKPGENPEQQ